MKTTLQAGILVLGRRRPGFDPDWGAHIVTQLNEALNEVAFTAFRPSKPIVDDPSLRVAVDECAQVAADTLVVVQPTMSDGNLAAALSQLWNGPLVLWATPENLQGSMISSCSLVGAHTFASTLRQLDHPFQLVYGMPGDPDCMRQLDTAVRLAASVRHLRRGKVGIIGYHAPGFIDMEADPFQLKTGLGPQLRHYGLRDLTEAMDALDQDRVAADVQAVQAAGMPLVDVTPEDLPIASRYYLAMRDLIAEESLDSLAVRCWSELPNVVGQWPYLAMVRLSTEGEAIACEGDVDGGVSCLIGSLLGFGQGYLSDWLAHTADTVTLWHAGNAALGLCDPVGTPTGPRITRHFNNRKPMVVDANLRADQPITLFRVWRRDNRYCMAACEAVTLPPNQPLLGTNGLARVADQDLRDYFEELCYEGMPHHVAVFAGHHGKTLRHFARLTNLAWIGA